MLLGGIRTTYLDHVQGRAGLGGHGPLVGPVVGEARHVEATHLLLRQANSVGDVVLLADAETVTQQGRGPQALVQLVVEVLLVLAGVQVGLEAVEQTQEGLVDGVALSNGDVLGHVPGKLAQGADHALVRTLGAIAREGRLWEGIHC